MSIQSSLYTRFKPQLEETKNKDAQKINFVQILAKYKNDGNTAMQQMKESFSDQLLVISEKLDHMNTSIYNLQNDIDEINSKYASRASLDNFADDVEKVLNELSETINKDTPRVNLENVLSLEDFVCKSEYEKLLNDVEQLKITVQQHNKKIPKIELQTKKSAR